MTSVVTIFGKILLFLSLGIMFVDLVSSLHFGLIKLVGLGDLLARLHEGVRTPYFWGVEEGFIWDFLLSPLLDGPASIILFCIGLLAILLPKGSSETI